MTPLTTRRRAPRTRLAPAMLVALAGVLCVRPAAAQRQPAPGPTLARLLEGARVSLPAFWDSVRARGTPIIDSVPGDSGHMLASFVYRADSVRNVVIENGVNGWTYALNQLERVPGTDIWHITVRLPADIRLGYMFRENDDLIPWFAEPDQAARWRQNRPDPFNARRDSLQGIRSVVLGSRAAPDVWSVPRAGVAAGTIIDTSITSAALGGERKVSVYLPPGTHSRDLPLLVVFDGWVYQHWLRVPAMLDNLIAAHKIRPVVVVFVQQVDRMTELAPNNAFGRFICRDVIDFARGRYRAGRSAGGTVLAGSSHGGLAASWIALRCPDRVGNVLAQSPSLWWSAPDAEPEAITREVARRPRLPLTWWLEVGRFEVDRAKGGAPGQVVVARHLRDVLTAKGYAVHYSEFSGGHEYQSWRVTMPAALEYLLPATATP